MNHINLKGDKLVITFKFDPRVVAAVKTLDGRVWKAADKHWEVPVDNVSDVVSALQPLGFTPHIDVKNLIVRERAERAIIEDIKVSGEGYTGSLPLFKFQQIGASFIKQMERGCLLADTPGLGKSIQSLAGTEHESQILIICPSTLKYSWFEEINKWIPNAKPIVIDGNKELRTSQWSIATKGYYRNGVNVIPKYVIANYELLLHDFDLIKDHEWPVIIADEATRISNPSAQTTKNLKLLKAKKRVPMTGTPISNSPDDIYSLIDWIAPGYLGSFYQFKNKYCVLGDYDKVVSYQNLDVLAGKINRFMLRRNKEEVFDDFPKKMVEYIKFDLPKSEREMYTAIKNQVIDEIHKLGDLDTRTLGIVPVKMLRLKQATGHTRLVGANGGGESTKLETLRELLKPIVASGEKAIVFTQFSSMLNILVEELKDFRPLAVYGEVLSVKRMVTVKEFNDDPNGRVIIMTEAGAFGLNMQSAAYVFHYDAPWSLSKLTQREDRAHRYGNKKPVTVYHLIARNTIDEYILKVLARKGKVSDEILQDVERVVQTDGSEKTISILESVLSEASNAGMLKEDMQEILETTL